MRSSRVILLSALALCVLVFSCSTAANAATANPATVHAISAGQSETWLQSSTWSTVSARGAGDYPYEIGPGRIQTYHVHVDEGKLELHVRLKWANSDGGLSLKVFEPGGVHVPFELSDGHIVYEAYDADDGTTDHMIYFVISNDDHSCLTGGDWTYEVISHSRTESIRFSI